MCGLRTLYGHDSATSGIDSALHLNSKAYARMGTMAKSKRPKRDAYRLGYETAKERIANDLDTVKDYRGRSILLLSVSAVVASFGVADVDKGASGCLYGIGWFMLGTGLAAAMAGVLRLNMPLKGQFEWAPQTFVRYGEMTDDFPTNDVIYESLAREGVGFAKEAEAVCTKRKHWIWASLSGLVLTFIGAFMLSIADAGAKAV